MTQLPPKLPLLYFEQDRVEHLDFAYRQPSGSQSTISSHRGLNGTSQQEASSPTDGKSSPKPAPPPINTRVGRDSNSCRREVIGTPEQEDNGDEEEEDENGRVVGTRGGSFYWHSPGSTENGDESPRPFDNEPNDKDEEKKEENDDRIREPLEIKPIVATIPENSLTSATALGFGGPSDWQHFTDYDAEEVDDLDLYVSHKPKTAELPAGTPTEETIEQPDLPVSPRRLLGTERDVLPTIQERASENLDEAKIEPAEQTPSTESSEESRTSLITSSSEDEAQITTPAKIIVQEPTDQTLPKKIVIEQAQQEEPQDEKRGEDDTPKSAPVQEETKPPPSDNSHSRVMSIQSSQLNSPVDDDDGKEQIIISLQVPDTPGPDKTEQNSKLEERPRERQLSIATNLEPKLVESPDMVRTGRMSVFPGSIELEDPYAGLDAWAKASLNRYVKMLKEEAAAKTDEEKFTIFINFAHRETRNRTALYDMDEDSDMENPVQIEKVKDSEGRLRSKVSVKAKRMPTVPPVATLPVQHQPTRAETMPAASTAQQPVPKDTPSQPTDADSNVKQRSHEKPQQPVTAPPQQTNFGLPATSDDSFVMVDNPTDEKPQTNKTKQIKEKSSGQLKEKGSGYLKEKSSSQSKDKQSSGKSGTSLSSLKKALDLVARSTGSKDRNAPPSNLQTLLTKAGDDSRKPASPVTKDSATPAEANQRPATPEKQDSKQNKQNEGEGRAYEGDKAANRQTIYRPFSGLLRNSSVARGGSADGGSKRSSVFDRRSTAAESSLSGKSPNPLDKPFEDYQKPRTKPVNYRYTILEPLLLVVPQEGILHQEPSQLSHLRKAMDAIPEDFSFIHKTVLAWDADAKKARERFERERHARQVQNETNIDALFNDQEIGYGDISQLEAEFKRSEASKKAEEDREEVQTFVARVFDVVWARINYEMDQLQPLYDQCVALVCNASAGRGMFEDTEERVPIAPSMECLLILYQKLNIRHQKAFEAVLERDRRLKKTEVAPWYALGSINEVKKIEKRFEDAEKKAILEFCRQRDERAGSLMDVLDQNTLRGVGSNQDYMESIMQAVRKISTDIAVDGVSDDDVISIDEVLKAKTITTALAQSSEQIVGTFHVADMLLNAADYEVSVANAQLSNANAAAFKRLRDAKAKEDDKLTMDLEHRMSLIRGDTARTQEEISKLLALVSKREGDSERSGSLGEQGSGGGKREKDSQTRGNNDAKRRAARK
jgi:hypothetical protein